MATERIASRKDHHTSLGLGLRLDWAAAIKAGFVAGTLFLALELVTAYGLGAGTPFGPAHATLHGLLGGEGLPDRVDPGLVTMGIFFHYLLSIVIVLPLAALVDRWWNLMVVIAVGGLMGFALYFFNAQLLDYRLPVWGEVRDVFMLVDYTIFGMACAYGYKRLQQQKSAGVPQKDDASCRRLE